MAVLHFDGRNFIYAAEGEETVLLDCGGWLTNKSAVSMQKLPGQDFLTIPALLLKLIQDEQQNNTDLAIPFGIMDILLAARLIRTAWPVRVLEYGCGDGRLSYHLAKILGAFHENSSLVCAYDTMDELWMQWMERISTIDKLPKISYLAGDYGDLQLEKNYFDIVVINGRTNFQEPGQVMEDALALVAKEGTLFCYTDQTPLLESVFQLYFETREEYEVTAASKVLLAEAKSRNWASKPETDMDASVRKDLSAAQRLLEQKQPERREAAALANTLLRDARSAGKSGCVDLKIRLVEAREALLKRTAALERPR